MVAKYKSGKTFTQIAEATGLTNVYVAQLFYNQSQLKPQYVERLQAAVPALTPLLLRDMQAAPNRRFDPALIQEPSIYRLYEAIMHGGEALKAIINEECGDGIMSAIDFYASIDKIQGKHGEQRVVITMNGKYLPYVAQAVEDDVAHRQPGVIQSAADRERTWGTVNK